MINETAFWNEAKEAPSLTSDEVSIWRVIVPEVSRGISHFETILSTDEKFKSDKFHFERDRQRYVIGRAILRILIGQYVSLSPQDIKFQYGTYGKPYLDFEQNSLELEFNLTHSNDFILCAFAIGRRVGIDIEKIQPVSNIMSTVESFFSPYEIAMIQGSSPMDREKAFYAYWTCKESYIKALGYGLSLPLNQFSISIGLRAEAQLLDVCWDKSEPQRWSIKQLLPATGYVSAVTVEGKYRAISYWHYQLDS